VKTVQNVLEILWQYHIFLHSEIGSITGLGRKPCIHKAIHTFSGWVSHLQLLYWVLPRYIYII